MSSLSQRTPRWLEAGALGAVCVALAWWALVYGQVMLNADFSLIQALPCLLNTSDRCSLAMSLCKNWHVLGIRRYSPELLWIGAAVGLLALALGRHRPGAADPKGGDHP